MAPIWEVLCFSLASLTPPLLDSSLLSFFHSLRSPSILTASSSNLPNNSRTRFARTRTAMAPNPILQQLIAHVESSPSADTLQVIFNWTAARLQDQARLHTLSLLFCAATDRLSVSSTILVCVLRLLVLVRFIAQLDRFRTFPLAPASPLDSTRPPLPPLNSARLPSRPSQV